VKKYKSHLYKSNLYFSGINLIYTNLIYIWSNLQQKTLNIIFDINIISKSINNLKYNQKTIKQVIKKVLEVEKDKEDEIHHKNYEEYLKYHEEYLEKIDSYVRKYIGWKFFRIIGEDEVSYFSLEKIIKNLQSNFKGDFCLIKSKCCNADFIVINLWKIKTFLFFCKKCHRLERIVWRKLSLGVVE